MSKCYVDKRKQPFVKARLDYMILSGRLCHIWFCHAWFFCLHWHHKIMCDFFSHLHNWEKKIEEDNIAVSVYIIIIDSAILRIRRDRRRPRVWARSWIRRRARYGALYSLIKDIFFLIEFTYSKDFRNRKFNFSIFFCWPWHFDI